MKKIDLDQLKPLEREEQKNIIKELQKVTNEGLNTNKSDYFFKNDLITSAIKEFSVNLEVMTYDSSEDIIFQSPEIENGTFYFKHMYELTDYPDSYYDNSNNISMPFEKGIFIIKSLFLNSPTEIINFNFGRDKIKIHFRNAEKIVSHITITG